MTVAVYMTRLVAFHVLWYFMPGVNQDSHGKFLNFTREYLRVITRGLSRVCEVIVELYRMYKHMHTSTLAVKNIRRYVNNTIYFDFYRQIHSSKL